MRVAALAALAVLAAAPAAAAAVPHRANVAKLYAKDHAGRQPAADGDLAPYSRPYERLLASCTIGPTDLTSATSSLAARVRAAGGAPFPTRSMFTNLGMLQALTRRVTWTARRDCWDTFFDVEAQLAQKAASAAVEYPRESEALYVYDHIGGARPLVSALVPYSNALEQILASCRVSAEDATNLMIHLSDMASQLGGREVTTLQMLQAIVRRIDWTSGKRICWNVFDDAEGHMEAGGP